MLYIKIICELLRKSNTIKPPSLCCCLCFIGCLIWYHCVKFPWNDNNLNIFENQNPQIVIVKLIIIINKFYLCFITLFSVTGGLYFMCSENNVVTSCFSCKNIILCISNTTNQFERVQEPVYHISRPSLFLQYSIIINLFFILSSK